jgi:hypothetical protein
MCRGGLFSLDHSQSHTTFGSTPLEEGSARRRDLYLTTQNTHKRQISMPPAEFEPTIPASERPKAHAFGRSLAGIDTLSFVTKFMFWGFVTVQILLKRVNNFQLQLFIHSWHKFWGYQGSNVSSGLWHHLLSRVGANDSEDHASFNFNPLKTKRICFIQGLSAYRAVNTLHFGYKNQSLNVL